MTNVAVAVSTDTSSDNVTIRLCCEPDTYQGNAIMQPDAEDI